MSLFVERKLDTGFGPIEIAITRGDHISVQGQPVVRDSKFNCHLHFFKQADGTYAVREQDRPNMTRAWDATKSKSFNESSPKSYFAKVLAEYTKVLNVFMASNPALADEAESQDIEREIGSAQAKVNKAREALHEAEEALAALEDKRRAHQGTKTLVCPTDEQGRISKALRKNLNRRELAHLDSIRQRFIDERTKGYRKGGSGPEAGKYVAPIPPAEALAVWLANESKFVATMKDPEVRAKLHLDEVPA